MNTARAENYCNAARRMDLWAEVMRRARDFGYKGTQRELDELRRQFFGARAREERLFSLSPHIERTLHFALYFPKDLVPATLFFYREGEINPIVTDADCPIEEWIHGAE